MHSEAERSARHVRLADDAVLLGPAPAARVLPRRRPHRRGRRAAAASPPSCRCLRRWPATRAWRPRWSAAGLTWVGPPADVLERLGGDGVEPASERGFLAWVTADGLRFTTAGLTGTAPPASRGCPGPPTARRSCRHAARRLADVGWRGLVTVGIAPGRRAGRDRGRFLPRHRRPGARARRRRGRAGAAQREPHGGQPGAGRGVPARRRRRPAALDAAAGDGGPGDRTSPGHGSGPGRASDVDVVAVSGYEPGDRLDGWYDALLATVSAAGPDSATAARAVADALSGLPEVGVPHDGDEVCAVLARLAVGTAGPGSLISRAWMNSLE